MLYALLASSCVTMTQFRNPLHCKKNSPWPGIIKLFQAREGLVSDIPAEDGKTANLFFTVKGEDFFITVILSSIDVNWI
jgi:hypothetical protein